MHCLFLTSLLICLYQTSAIRLVSKDPEECHNRYEFRHELPEMFSFLKNCTAVHEMKPICAKPIVVMYSEHPPYVLQNKTTGKAVGLLPGMLRLALESCCFHCINLTFIGPLNVIDKFMMDNATIIMPVESSKTGKTFIAYDYIHFLEVKGVSFLSKEIKGRAEKLSSRLFLSVLGTWPLFLVAFLMAIAAGLVVWVLDTWFNREEFPSSFPRGPFEGFWWAFVSMTTVGYGDRAPKSVVARLFAVLWILLGITIFSMYTATLTSALTENIESMAIDSPYGKKVGVLRTTAAGLSAAVQENAIPKVYDTVEQMVVDLRDDKIFAIALDDYIANYYFEHIKKQISDLERHQHIKLEYNSYGVVSYDEGITKFLRTFFQSNEDNRIAMMSQVNNAHFPDIRDEDVNEISKQGFFTTSSPVFYGTLIGLVILGIATTAIGLTCKWFFKRHQKILNRWISFQESKKVKKKAEDVEMKPMVSLQDDFNKELDQLKVKWTKILESKSNGNA